MVRPKKHLGQHFLTDPAIAERIVRAMTPGGDRVVIEIGPGKGVLTQFLLQEKLRRFIPIEIDKESYDYLINEWPQLKEEILLHDFLRIDVASMGEKQLQIIGNFPYNISSQIFFKALENRSIVSEVVCMIQKEVAERLVSPPGSKQYGILSVLLQAFYDLEYLFTVKPGSFFPPPKVKSGVIKLTRNKTGQLDCDEKLFFQVVKTSFNQRRKTIRNSIKTILLNLHVESELLSKRPEQLSVTEFIELTNLIDNKRKE
jgi:16S rRNA (adenine1518-N6/adenine1519-N6)-dimethyltransferase